MTPESTILLQKIDCNCNDCIFMQRDTAKYKESLDKHQKWALEAFELEKGKLTSKAQFEAKNGRLNKAQAIYQTRDRMKFQFDRKEVSINYGKCTKFGRGVSFIPNTIQLDTQNCFKHRRETNN